MSKRTVQIGDIIVMTGYLSILNVHKVTGFEGNPNVQKPLAICDDGWRIETTDLFSTNNKTSYVRVCDYASSVKQGQSINRALNNSKIHVWELQMKPVVPKKRRK